jgi:hypothetical protein
MPWHDMPRQGTGLTRMAWYGVAWHGMACHGMTWHGMAEGGVVCD